MPYKDPEKQREYQANWLKKRRLKWFARQFCCLCRHRTGLSVLADAGAPKLSWSGSVIPSHKRYRVVCEDADACLRRRESAPAVPDIPEKTGTARKAKPQHVVVEGGEVKINKPKASKIERDLLKPDRRHECPVHGPRNTIKFNDQRRFVCCGHIHEAL